MTYPSGIDKLRGARVFITGATGFIGGRLVERLILRHGASVRALVRSYHRAVRLARFDLDILRADLTDTAALREAMNGCDVVIHCAFGGTGDAQEQRRATVDGTSSVISAARQAGVKRMVHLSTLSVYGPLTTPTLNENATHPKTGDVYSDSKIEAESLALDAHRSGDLSVAVIQPTVVYGPFGGWWTAGQIDRLKRGRLALPDPSRGVCNAVYVDDVAQAIELAAVNEQAGGETFLISGPHPVTWEAFFAAYEGMLGRKSIVKMPVEEIRCRHAQTRPPRTIFGWALGVLRERDDIRERLAGSTLIGLPYRAARRLTPSPIKRRLLGPAAACNTNDGDNRPIIVPDTASLPQFTANTVVQIDKAKRLLGYEPTYDLERGMKLTEQWARWAGLL